MSAQPGSFVALLLAPPAGPPEGRRADCTTRGARATRRVAYTEGARS